jgi:CRP/FNR family transcriptional regulator
MYDPDRLLFDEIEIPAAFAGIGEETLASLRSAAIQRTFTAGQIIVHQGDSWPYLFQVISGEIEVMKSSCEGRLFIAATIRQRETFWGITFFQELAPSPVLLQAKVETTVLLWNRETLLPYVRTNAVLAWNLCQIMVARMLQASDIVEDLAFQPVMARLAGLMLETFGDVEDEYVARSMTLDDMAARIGSTREMVCRHLYKFAEQGAIEIKRTELKIIDRALLQKQAGKNK